MADEDHCLSIINSEYCTSESEEDESDILSPREREESSSNDQESTLNAQGSTSNARDSPQLKEAITTTESTPTVEIAEDNSADSQQESSSDVQSPLKKRRGKYAIGLDCLPPSLEVFLRNAKDFFTSKITLERTGPAVAQATMDKVLERAHCYLGYCKNNKGIPEEHLCAALFTNQDLIQAYLNYLEAERKLNPSTIANHIGAIIYMVKYIRREKSATRYRDDPMINQLRNLATELQKEGDINRLSTVEDLTSANKWLSWEEILECVRVQQFKVDISKGDQKAREFMDLVLVALYTHSPPARGLEIRTLKYFAEEENNKFNIKEHSGSNYLVHHSSGEFKLHLYVYKTAKFRGHDEVLIESDSELHRLISDYIKLHRKRLLVADTNTEYVFVNSNGQPFAGPAFTKHLQKIFNSLSGTKVSVNAIRSSFITFAYAQGGSSESLRHSLANALRHSKRQAECTYDRRTAVEKKKEALSFAQNVAEASLSSEHQYCVETPSHTTDAQRRRSHTFKAGDFVGVIEASSTLSRPKILIGRICCFLNNEEVVLSWYKRASGGTYKLHCDDSCWIENINNLVLVNVTPCKEVDTFKLDQSLRSIHKVVSPDK